MTSSCSQGLHLGIQSNKVPRVEYINYLAERDPLTRSSKGAVAQC